MLEELKRALSAHDWYYVMSDDNSIYNSGKDSELRLLSLIGKAIYKHGDEARKVVRDFHAVRSAKAKTLFNPYNILNHYM